MGSDKENEVTGSLVLEGRRKVLLYICFSAAVCSVSMRQGLKLKYAAFLKLSNCSLVSDVSVVMLNCCCHRFIAAANVGSTREEAGVYNDLG